MVDVLVAVMVVVLVEYENAVVGLSSMIILRSVHVRHGNWRSGDCTKHQRPSQDSLQERFTVRLTDAKVCNIAILQSTVVIARILLACCLR